MATVFLFCLFLVIYTYLGYGIVLYLMVKTKRLFGHYNRGFFNNECLPDVTLMVCAYNEEDIVEKKNGQH